MKIAALILLWSLITICGADDSPLQQDLVRRLQVLNDPDSRSVLVTAHRAMHTQYPENSMAAVEHAMKTGVDMIEIDVRQTRDGVLILMHDHTIDRTTNGEGNVRDLTYAALKNYKLRSFPEDSLKHFIPTLKEVLEKVKDKILVDIDIKDAPVSQLVKTVFETQTQAQVLFFQHHNATHDSIKYHDSKLMVCPRADTAEDVKNFISILKPVTIQIPDKIASPELIRLMNEAGCKVWINALGKADALAEKGHLEEAFKPLVQAGANIIQSDRPDLLLQYLRETGHHW